MTSSMNNSQVLEAIAKHRARKERIVFTNGCFDLLHPGHVRYLAEAKALGDILVVAINSDESVQRLKGPTRPINNVNFRREMLLGLKSVDYVCVFAEDTPYDIVRQVMPNVVVKGGDWAIKDIVGHELMEETGGKTYSIAFADGFSSTDMIGRILKAHGCKAEPKE